MDYVPRNMAFCCALTNHAVKQNAYTRAVPIAHPYVPGRGGASSGSIQCPFPGYGNDTSPTLLALDF